MLSQKEAESVGFDAIQSSFLRKISQAAIFNTMRILKRINPGDCYLENYLGHLQKSGEDFYDTYMLLWEISAVRAPKKILEIGTRTGISLCQLLSGYIDNSIIRKVVCIDPFADGYTSPALVRRNLNYLNLPGEMPEIITGFSQDVLPNFSRKEEDLFDYILVDGDHEKEAARKDLEAAHQLLGGGGVIVFDDISDAPGECALIDVWEAFVTEHGAKYETGKNMSGKGVAWAIKLEE